MEGFGEEGEVKGYVGVSPGLQALGSGGRFSPRGLEFVEKLKILVRDQPRAGIRTGKQKLTKTVPR